MTFDPSSREAEAQAEIAATRLGRGVAAVLVAGGALLLASGPLVELPAAARGRSAIVAGFAAAATDAGLLATTRARFDEVELRFDERSALVRSIRPHAQALLTRFGRYGNERTVVGRDGWLYFRDDVEHITSRANGAGFLGDPPAAIRGFRAELAAHGIGLVIAPTPLKPTVHPDKLSRDADPPPLRRTGERDLLVGLTGEGIDVLDLADPFARDGRIAPLYLAGDTHWRPEAVEIAARELAILLRRRFELPAGDRTLRAGEIEHRSAIGDTAALLELPSRSSLLFPERVAARAVTGGSTTPAEVLLLGDSFAGIYSSSDLGWGSGAGLADRLAAQLGLPVDRILRNAGGASATRRALADTWRREPARFGRLRVVVWQFAARELSQGEWKEIALPSPERPPMAGEAPSSE